MELTSGMHCNSKESADHIKVAVAGSHAKYQSVPSTAPKHIQISRPRPFSPTTIKQNLIHAQTKKPKMILKAAPKKDNSSLSGWLLSDSLQR